jgi:DNA-binding IclR family transcriptional regulator
MTAPFIAAELPDRGGPAARAGLRTMTDVNALLDDVRAQGFATGTMHKGIVAASAPIFDYTGRIVAALALVGLEGVLDLKPDGRPVRTLLKAVANLSKRLGALVPKASTEVVSLSPPAETTAPHPRKAKALRTAAAR